MLGPVPPAGAQALGPLSAPASASFSATLTGDDLQPTYALPLSVPDTRTSPTAGWKLTITSTRFATTGGTVRTLANGASAITGVDVACQVAPCAADPTNAVNYPINVPAGATAPAAVKFFNAATDTGRGTFTITPTIRVTVPGNAYAGTYRSTVTTTLSSGP